MFNRLKSFARFQKIKEWYIRYERFLIPGSLVLGVIVDAVTFRSIDLKIAFSILFAHLVLSLLTITFAGLYDVGKIKVRGRSIEYLRLFAPLVIQYTFGALLSGFLIFYGFGGTVAASWPFILMIVFLLVSNDLLKRHYVRLIVQISVYYFCLFSFLALVFPFLFRTIDVAIFVLSGVASLVFIFSYIYIFSRFSLRVLRERKILASGVGLVFVVMNFLYFTNIIPPIPLSLKDAGVYHKVERIAPGEYLVLGEEKIWYDRLKLYQTFTLSSENRTIYLYAAVFAPTELTTNIVHHWHYFDESKKRWVSISRITYAITGGRDGGFRGYSYKTNVFPGRWRVDVETLRGQLIGRVRFVAHEAIESPQIKREIK